jgi:hypothetical protein
VAGANDDRPSAVCRFLEAVVTAVADDDLVEKLDAEEFAY